MKSAANLVEIFSSIQGEGLYVGCRQIFVRFSECNLKCRYCDTPQSRTGAKDARIEQTAGRRDFIYTANPISVEELAHFINRLTKLPHHSISLTGGEPLCHSSLIAALAPRLNGRIYLETNGTLCRELAVVLPHIDIISMDIKLPSAGAGSTWDEHRSFLKLASECSVFVKIVVTADTTTEEFVHAVELVAGVSARIPLIIQPVTPNEFCGPISPEAVLLLQEQALQVLRDVRVVPQTHKFLGQL
ncbi:MAG: 7-carboxy-7-deazaguanine synthase QueE [Negativicutes bacterium]|nr:7-carboxy-7-deazaguanine synthase QueE [Negativicutes bacterium]